MSQAFEYPNLVAQTGDIATAHVYVSDGGPVSETVGADAVVGRYKHIVFPSDVHLWAIITAQMSDAFRDVPEGTRLSISAFLRVNGGPEILNIYIHKFNATGSVIGDINRSYLNVRGGVVLPRRYVRTQRHRIQRSGSLHKGWSAEGRFCNRHCPADGLHRRRTTRMGTGRRGGAGVNERS